MRFVFVRVFTKSPQTDPPAALILPPTREEPVHRWVASFDPLDPLRPRLIPADPAFQASYPPGSFFCDHPALKERSWPITDVDIPATYVVTIPRGRTIGARGTVIGPDNVLVGEISMRQSRKPVPHFLLLEPPLNLKKPRRLKGRYALLSSYGTSTYHWIYDSVPRCNVLWRAGFKQADFDGFLVRRPKYQPHYQLFELMGIPEEKIVWCTQNSHYECEELVVPSFTTDQIVNNQREHHPWVFSYLKSLAGPLPAPDGKRRRVLINRKDSRSTARQIVNQSDLAALLAKYGFEEVTLGELDFLEQARLFASAEFIVAAHGGGLSNLCFCDPATTKLLELFAPDYVLTHFRNIARMLGIDYQPLVMESAKNADEKTFGGDIRADLAQVEAIIQAMLSSPATITR